MPDPAAAVAEMVRLVRPGGWVALLEPDNILCTCYPPHPAWDRLVQIFMQANEADCADADIYPAGHSRRAVRLDLVDSMRPKIIALGLASESELDDAAAAVRQHLDDPDTLVLPHLLFLAWGTRPRPAAS